MDGDAGPNLENWGSIRYWPKRAPKILPRPIQSLFLVFCIKIKLCIIFSRRGRVRLRDAWKVEIRAWDKSLVSPPEINFWQQQPKITKQQVSKISTLAQFCLVSCFWQYIFFQDCKCSWEVALCSNFASKTISFLTIYTAIFAWCSSFGKNCKTMILGSMHKILVKPDTRFSCYEKPSKCSSSKKFLNFGTFLILKVF